ncbi:MAG: DegT/DnrJ/EryC1/StrS family aminotransferase [Bacteroidota bacterium]
MKIPFVNLGKQYNSIRNEIDSAIAEVIAGTAFIGGKYVSKFESEFAEYLGVQHCIGCANGTDAIEILLKAYGIGADDEVIVPAHTWISTAEAVSNAGAVPVFIDSHPDIYTIDTSKIEEKISHKTKAIIPVHLYGLPADMDEIMQIAKKHNLIVIEDSAQAHGAEYKGRKAGTIGDASIFSFYPSKNLGAYGDAGCMVTNDESIAKTARMIANHGQVRKHEHLISGRNSRLDGLQATILSVKLKYLDAWNNSRIKNAELYRKYLSGVNVKLPSVPEGSMHVYHVFAIQIENRMLVQKALNDAGVETAIHYPAALPFVTAFKDLNYKHEDFPVCTGYIDRILSLPMYAELKEEEIVYICEKIKKIIK